MKKNLFDIFGEAGAEELQPLLENDLPVDAPVPNKSKIHRAVMERIRTDADDEHELHPVFDEPKGRKRRAAWIPFVAVAACLCLLLGWVFSLPRNIPGNAVPPVLTPPDVQENGIRSPEDVINDFSYDQILWNPGTVEDDVPLQPDKPADPSSPSEPMNTPDISIPVDDEWVIWNGLKVTPKLYKYLQSQPTAHLAVKAHSLKKPEVALSDFELNGVSYAALEKKRAGFWNAFECVACLHKYVDFALEAGEMQPWMEDQIASLDPNYINLDDYRTEDGSWALEKIITEETALSDAIRQLDQEREELYKAWQTQNGNPADLSCLAEFGFYLVSTGTETTIAIVTPADMAAIGEILVAHFPDMVENTLFDMAYRSDVGVDWDVPEYPTTDDWTEPPYSTAIGETMGPPVITTPVVSEDLTFTIIGSAVVSDSVYLPDSKVMYSDVHTKEDCVYYTYDIPALTPLIEALPEDWFHAYRIIFVRTSVSSGSTKHQVTNVRLTEHGELFVDISTEAPTIGTMDLCREYIAIAVDANTDISCVWVEETYVGYETGLGPALPSEPSELPPSQ